MNENKKRRAAYIAVPLALLTGGTLATLVLLFIPMTELAEAAGVAEHEATMSFTTLVLLVALISGLIYYALTYAIISRNKLSKKNK